MPGNLGRLPVELLWNRAQQSAFPWETRRLVVVETGLVPPAQELIDHIRMTAQMQPYVGSGRRLVKQRRAYQRTSCVEQVVAELVDSVRFILVDLRHLDQHVGSRGTNADALRRPSH